ncbi:MAG: hypothetical protein O7A03_10465 [Alphaproteobacteria bacterium]|nr:hypothetical protein [Alphaproteobacteria bacterium]
MTTSPSRRHTLLCICAGMAAFTTAAIGPANALAGEIIIHVRVNIQDLPDGAEPNIYCKVTSPLGPFGPIKVASGSQDFSPLGNAFDGAVFVKIASDNDRHLASANRYHCELRLARTSTTIPPLTYEDCMAAGIDPVARPLECGAEGTPVVSNIYGDL